MPLSRDKKVAYLDGKFDRVDVAGSTHIFNGAAVVLNAAGFAVPASAATGLRPLGVAREHVDNRDGADGAASVQFERGIFHFNSGTGADTITDRHRGRTAYWIDDETVGLTDTGRSAAGEIVRVDARGVWVKVGA